MLIPHDLLEADTLNNLLEDFVTREGTDNGDETPLDVRVERARHASVSYTHLRAHETGA
ncbi:hypothetical protein FA119_29660, partial [Pseudomonas aeruginosa]|nr:hypothetical protein [Pseudomonas aeruginosa]